MAKYRAFISYSQLDKRWAQRIHRALETFQVPADLLIETVGKDRKLGRLFLDTEEKRAETNIDAALKGALEESESLIVICSPNAVGSRFVNEEITYFKANNPDGAVLPVIIAGEPNSGGETECFPPALTRKVLPDGTVTDGREEPFAADGRKGKESFARIKAQLVAGILDIDFDRLWQREKRRIRNRRIRNGAIAAGLVVAGLAGAWWQGSNLASDRSQQYASAAADLYESDDFNLAARMALNGLRDNGLFAPDRYSVEAEGRFLQAALKDRFHGIIRPVLGENEGDWWLMADADLEQFAYYIDEVQLLNAKDVEERIVILDRDSNVITEIASGSKDNFAFSEDGTQIAVTRWDEPGQTLAVDIFTVDTGARRSVLLDERFNGAQLAYAPDFSTITAFTRFTADFVGVASLETGELLFEADYQDQVPDNVIKTYLDPYIVYSPDAQAVFIRMLDSGLIFNMDSGPADPLGFYSAPYNQAVFSRSGTYVYGRRADDDTVNAFDVSSGAYIGAFDSCRVTGMTQDYTPDGINVTCTDAAFLLDPAKPVSEQPYKADWYPLADEHQGYITVEDQDISQFSDDLYIMSRYGELATFEGVSRDGNWIYGYQNNVLNPDLSGNFEEDIISLWRTESPDIQPFFNSEQRGASSGEAPEPISFWTRGDRIDAFIFVEGYNLRELQYYDGTSVRLLPNPEDLKYLSPTMSRDGTMLTSVVQGPKEFEQDDGSYAMGQSVWLVVKDITTGQELSIQDPDLVTAAQDRPYFHGLSDDNAHVWLALGEGGVKLFDAATGEKIWDVSLSDTYATEIRAASRRGDDLLIGNRKGEVVKLDLRTGKTKNTWQVSDTEIKSLAVSPQGDRVAVALNWGPDNQRLRIWDIDRNAPADTRQLNIDTTYDTITWHPSGDYLFAEVVGLNRLYHVPSGLLLDRYTVDGDIFGFTEDGAYVIYEDRQSDGLIKHRLPEMLLMSPEEARAWYCARQSGYGYIGLPPEFENKFQSLQGDFAPDVCGTIDP